MGQHARLSASQTAMWAGCAGSLAMNDLLPEGDRNVGSDFARLGTCAHALLERVLSEGVDPEAYRGRIITIVGEGTEKEGTSILRKGAKAPKDPTRFWAEVDDDMIDAVDVAVSYVRGRLQELFGHSDTKAAVAKKQLRLETRLTILVDREDSFGTGDVIIDAWPETLEIFDYKHGSGVLVEVKGNKQTRSYAVGVAELDGWDHETYRHTICQPRIGHSDGRVRWEEMTRQEVLDFRAFLLEKAARVDEADRLADITPDKKAVPDALMEAGLLVAGDHCRWCEAKYNRALDRACPAIRKAAEEAAMADFDDDPRADTGREIPRDPEELGRILSWAPVVDSFIREIEAQAQKLAMSGTRVPGHKVVRGKAGGGRKIVELRPEVDELGEPVLGDDGEPVMVPVTEEWLLATLRERFGVKKEDAYTEPKLRSGPQLEAAVKKAGGKAKAEEFDRDFLYMPEGKLTLVPEDDPREEVQVDPAADFDDEPVEVPE